MQNMSKVAQLHKHMKIGKPSVPSVLSCVHINVNHMEKTSFQIDSNHPAADLFMHQELRQSIWDEINAHVTIRSLIQILKQLWKDEVDQNMDDHEAQK